MGLAPVPGYNIVTNSQGIQVYSRYTQEQLDQRNAPQQTTPKPAVENFVPEKPFYTFDDYAAERAAAIKSGSFNYGNVRAASYSPPKTYVNKAGETVTRQPSQPTQTQSQAEHDVQKQMAQERLQEDQRKNDELIRLRQLAPGALVSGSPEYQKVVASSKQIEQQQYDQGRFQQSSSTYEALSPKSQTFQYQTGTETKTFDTSSSNNEISNYVKDVQASGGKTLNVYDAKTGARIGTVQANQSGIDFINQIAQQQEIYIKQPVNKQQTQQANTQNQKFKEYVSNAVSSGQVSSFDVLNAQGKKVGNIPVKDNFKDTYKALVSLASASGGGLQFQPINKYHPFEASNVNGLVEIGATTEGSFQSPEEIAQQNRQNILDLKYNIQNSKSASISESPVYKLVGANIIETTPEAEKLAGGNLTLFNYLKSTGKLQSEGVVSFQETNRANPPVGAGLEADLSGMYVNKAGKVSSAEQVLGGPAESLINVGYGLVEPTGGIINPIIPNYLSLGKKGAIGKEPMSFTDIVTVPVPVNAYLKGDLLTPQEQKGVEEDILPSAFSSGVSTLLAGKGLGGFKTERGIAYDIPDVAANLFLLGFGAESGVGLLRNTIRGSKIVEGVPIDITPADYVNNINKNSENTININGKPIVKQPYTTSFVRQYATYRNTNPMRTPLPEDIFAFDTTTPTEGSGTLLRPQNTLLEDVSKEISNKLTKIQNDLLKPAETTKEKPVQEDPLYRNVVPKKSLGANKPTSSNVAKVDIESILGTGEANVSETGSPLKAKTYNVEPTLAGESKLNEVLGSNISKSPLGNLLNISEKTKPVQEDPFYRNVVPKKSLGANKPTSSNVAKVDVESVLGTGEIPKEELAKGLSPITTKTKPEFNPSRASRIEKSNDLFDITGKGALSITTKTKSTSIEDALFRNKVPMKKLGANKPTSQNKAQVDYNILLGIEEEPAIGESKSRIEDITKAGAKRAAKENPKETTARTPIGTPSTEFQASTKDFTEILNPEKSGIGVDLAKGKFYGTKISLGRGTGFLVDRSGKGLFTESNINKPTNPTDFLGPKKPAPRKPEPPTSKSNQILEPLIEKPKPETIPEKMSSGFASNEIPSGSGNVSKLGTKKGLTPKTKSDQTALLYFQNTNRRKKPKEETTIETLAYPKGTESKFLTSFRSAEQILSTSLRTNKSQIIIKEKIETPQKQRSIQTPKETTGNPLIPSTRQTPKETTGNPLIPSTRQTPTLGQPQKEKQPQPNLIPTPTKNKAIGILLPNDRPNIPKKEKHHKKNTYNFLGNASEAEVVGLTRRADITYGNKLTAKLTRQDIAKASRGTFVVSSINKPSKKESKPFNLYTKTTANKRTTPRQHKPKSPIISSHSKKLRL
jgi:hypothetical protein